MSMNPEQNSAQTDQRKVAGVIVTHGHLAGELLAAAEMIIGPISHITAVSIGWHDDVDAARDEVQRAITRVSQGVGVLLMTDMFGGTPTNIASMFLEDGKVEVITGINLPMVIKLGTRTGEGSLNEIARRVCDLGRQGIYVAGDLLSVHSNRTTRVARQGSGQVGKGGQRFRERFMAGTYRGWTQRRCQVNPKCIDAGRKQRDRVACNRGGSGRRKSNQ
jgi:PTS system mannose-specific IIA component